MNINKLSGLQKVIKPTKCFKNMQNKSNLLN